MGWHYQIVKYKDGSGYGIHEVFTDDLDEPWGRTEAPEISPVDPIDLDESEDGPHLVRSIVARILADIIELPVLDEPEVWPGNNPLDDVDLEPKEYDDLEHDMNREGE